MKLVEIDGSWIRPDKVIAVYDNSIPGSKSTTGVMVEGGYVFSTETDVSIYEVAAIINKGLE